MVTTSDRIAHDARSLFNEATLPDAFDFYSRLSPLHQRLFVVDVWQALSRCSIADSTESARDLLQLVEGWEATADLDAAPEVASALHAPKVRKPVSF